MNEVVLMLIAFIIVYSIYLILIVFNKKGRKKIKTGIEAKFLKKVYKIDLNKINDKKIANSIALNNSIIIAFVFQAILNIQPRFYFKIHIFKA